MTQPSILPVRDWAAVCNVCGTFALVRLRDSKPIMLIARTHELENPRHHVSPMVGMAASRSRSALVPPAGPPAPPPVRAGPSDPTKPPGRQEPKATKRPKRRRGSGRGKARA